MSYTHFTLDERKYLQKLLSEGLSMRKIAAILERSPSSVSREIKRNKTKSKPKKKSDNPYLYNHWRAQTLYICRRRGQSRAVLKQGTAEWDFIVDGLHRYWSPETICGRWHTLYPERKKLCFSTIYRYIKQRRFPQITAKENLRRHGKRLTKKDFNYNTIQPDRIIPEWSEEIKQRARIGDWEGDTVHGAIGKGLLVTMVDRKTRYLLVGKVANRTAELTEETICSLLKNIPVKSISLDNGSEFANFRQIEQRVKAPIYFAEPHKPWQRGTNENTNDIIRFFFPKGTDFNSVPEEKIMAVVSLINSRPRKCLNWLSPFEVFWGVALA